MFLTGAGVIGAFIFDDIMVFISLIFLGNGVSLIGAVLSDNMFKCHNKVIVACSLKDQLLHETSRYCPE